MKRHTYLSLALVAGLAVAGCKSDEFFDIPQYSILPEDMMMTDESTALNGLTGIYDIFYPEGTDADTWNYKPQIFFATHPTLDTQAGGWDADFGRQQIPADQSDVAKAWKYCYRGVDRCNSFLALLDEATDEQRAWPSYNALVGEAKAIRAYLYMFLTQNWGLVPMLATGETYMTAPEKGPAENYDQLWDFIIADLTDAADKLDWKPYKDQYGRCTKGMALSYLGDAYLWKAYREAGDDHSKTYNVELVKKARDAFKKVIDEGPYELAPSYSTLFDGDVAWPKEAIWQVVMDMGAGMYASWDYDCHLFNTFFSASTDCASGRGGWGSQYNSWELYFSFEKGDKRRDASLCTAPVSVMDPAMTADKGEVKAYDPQYEGYKGASWGYNPFVQEYIGYFSNDPDKLEDACANKPGSLKFKKYEGADILPQIWSEKYWRLTRAYWGSRQMSPCHYYYKRLPAVMLDYAECLFRLNEDVSTAWGMIDKVRNRAFGNLETSLAPDYGIQHFNSFPNFEEGDWADYKKLTEYPIPFNREEVAVEDAQTYYTKVASATEGGLSQETHDAFTGDLEVWEVALLQERRKEFNQEWNLKADLQRSNAMVAHINHNYVKQNPKADKADGYNWHYWRDWDFNPAKMLMPIPVDELLRNSLMKQNPGY